jgi:hypothetical protein
MWKELNEHLIPAALRLREKIAKTEAGQSDLLSLKRKFVREEGKPQGLMDLMLEGFDLIREGLKKKKDEKSYELIYRGRDKLREAARYHRAIEQEVRELLEKYYIRMKKREKS